MNRLFLMACTVRRTCKVATLLPEETRLAIIRKVKALKGQARATT